MFESTLLARQSIYDLRLNVYAYELLFRAGEDTDARFADGSSASSTVLLNAFTALPMSDVLEGKPAFVNFTRDLLENALPIDPSQLVIEVLENVVIDNSTIQALTKLKSDGYRIALDDYVYAEHHVELLELADIVKIDVLKTDADQMEGLLARLKPYRLRLLAEKVETADMYRRCRAQGFELFQGYFLSRPQIVKGRTLSSNQQGALRLMTALRQPGIQMRDVDQLINTDALLALKVLRLVNSTAFGIGRKIESIQRAVMMLGLERIRGLAQLMILAGLEEKPSALFSTTLLRARLGQVLAEQADDDELNSASQFTIGLLSTLDAYLDMDCREILADLPIPDEMKAAILDFSGVSGKLLHASIQFERGNLDQIDWRGLTHIGIPPTHARDLYFDSLRWVASVVSSM